MSHPGPRRWYRKLTSAFGHSPAAPGRSSDAGQVLAGSERSARRVGEFEVEVTYPCGHTASFGRADDQPFSAADVGEVLLTSCACAEDSP